MTRASVVFISGHRFGAEALHGLITSDAYKSGAFSIASILALHPEHSLSIVGYADLQQIARKSGLQAIAFHSLSSDQVAEHLSATPHDYLLAVGLSQLVPSRLLDLPMQFNGANQRHSSTHGCIGMHPTLLPVGRGRAPIPWSIIYGIRTTGVTAFLLQEEADVGDIVATESFYIEPEDDAGGVFLKAAKCHRLLGAKIAPLLAARTLTFRPQSHETASNWTRRRPRDGWIDFCLDTTTLLTLIHASAVPYPGAFFVFEHITVLVDEAQPVRGTTGQPGIILEVAEGAVTIATSDAALRVTKYRTIGGQPCFDVGIRLCTSEETVLDEA